MVAKGSHRARRTKLGVYVTNLRGRPAREASKDASSDEDARELARMLALINGRGSVADWESPEDRQ